MPLTAFLFALFDVNGDAMVDELELERGELAWARITSKQINCDSRIHLTGVRVLHTFKQLGAHGRTCALRHVLIKETVAPMMCKKLAMVQTLLPQVS